MKSLLSSSELKVLWENYQALLSTETQIHINHDGCEAGTDTKKRLYLKGTDEGMVAFCHHCGKGGFLRTKKEPKRLELLKEEAKVVKPKLRFPTTECVAFDKWPTEPKLWWLSHEMTEEDAHTYAVLWHEPTCRLILSGVNLKQGRAFYGHSPKYLTQYGMEGVEVFKRPLSRALFVCEDLMSAYKLHKAGATVLCLTGTNFNYWHLTVCSGYTTTVLWLDGDVAGALGGAHMYKELNALTEVLSLSSKQEPKETPLTELQNIVSYYNHA